MNPSPTHWSSETPLPKGNPEAWTVGRLDSDRGKGDCAKGHRGGWDGNPHGEPEDTLDTGYMVVHCMYGPT